MKRLIAWLLVFTLVVSMAPVAFGATDEAVKAADTLYALGLFSGTGKDANGNPIYTLDRAPTRQEAITMLVQILGKGEEAKNGTWETPFTDVANWAKPFVGYAYENGLTSGTSATTFGGNDLISASQYLTFILKALGYQVGTDFQWNKAWELSDALGITNGEYSASTKTFLRGDVTKISCNALSAHLKNDTTLLIQDLVNKGAVDGEAAVEQGLDAYGITNHVHLHYDIRTFTLYAFMNYTGYDDNNGRPITGVRKALRDDLAAMDITISDPDYYATSGAREYVFAQTLDRLGPAPDFKFYPDVNSNARPIMDLPEKLAEFYVAADIPTLYEKYRPDHEELLEAYSAAFPDLIQMVCYFDAQNDVDIEFGLEIILLDAWNRGSGLGDADSHYGYGVIRSGPAEGVNVLNFLHEFAHGFVGDAIDNSDREGRALSRYYLPNSDAVKRQGYEGWGAIVNESFVRAISLYFDSSTPEVQKAQSLNKEVSQGFVMTKYVYDRIPEFETFDGDFNAFVKMLLVEYPNYA